MVTAGYSGTSLVKKLGLKDNYVIRVFQPPGNYFELLPDLPDRIQQVNNKKSKKISFIILQKS